MKEKVAAEIAKMVRDGDILGVGTGSTVAFAIKAIGDRVSKEGLKLRALVTSHESAFACQSVGITCLDPISVDKPLRLGFDGADEVDPQGRLIKGRGAAMLREKILASRCTEYVVIADESKIVSRLGERVPVPVEVIPEAINSVKARLIALGATEITVRNGAPALYGPAITEKGNMILDARFSNIGEHAERDLKSITGVVETGLFFGYSTTILIAMKDGVEVRKVR